MSYGGNQAFKYKIYHNSQRKLARIIAALVITGWELFEKSSFPIFTQVFGFCRQNHLPLQIPLFAFKNAATSQSGWLQLSVLSSLDVMTDSVLEHEITPLWQ